MKRKIKNALISVFSKERLDEIAKELNKLGIDIYSTGGTQTFIEKLGIGAIPVEDLTKYPSILGGRVKTLHPKVFGGILSRRENEEDQGQMKEYELTYFDAVIVDLYPFEETVATKGISEQQIIEKIDIGGIALIRAAAKNFKDVVVISHKGQYGILLDLLETQKGETNIEQRRNFAKQAFEVSSHYDTAIYNYFNGGKVKELRYGENPHQKGYFHGDLDAMFDQLHGKELSYNNLLDADAAVNLIGDFKDTTFAIIKHQNACGIASREKLVDAYQAAFAGDPVSAFGGVLISNKKIDKKTADKINKLFFEIIIAPGYHKKALEVLKQKKNRRILIQKPLELPTHQSRSCLNGDLKQEKDLNMETSSDMEVVTKIAPNESELNDLEFANKVVKNSKSNTIVLAKDGQLLASGVGQTSRVDALEQAIKKAKTNGFDLRGAVMASDAFFPFPDCVEIAHKAGITAVIQPGGSVKDKESVAYCDENGMAMVVTGIRHFRH